MNYPQYCDTIDYLLVSQHSTWPVMPDEAYIVHQCYNRETVETVVLRIANQRKSFAQ